MHDQSDGCRTARLRTLPRHVAEPNDVLRRSVALVCRRSTAVGQRDYWTLVADNWASVGLRALARPPRPPFGSTDRWAGAERPSGVVHRVGNGQDGTATSDVHAHREPVRRARRRTRREGGFAVQLVSWATMAALSIHTCSRLMRPSRKSKTCRMRKVIRRPLPGNPRNSPVTVPVIDCSRIIESPEK